MIQLLWESYEEANVPIDARREPLRNSSPGKDIHIQYCLLDCDVESEREGESEHRAKRVRGHFLASILIEIEIQFNSFM